MAERVRLQRRVAERAERKQRMRKKYKGIREMRAAWEASHRGFMRIPEGAALPNLRLVKEGDIFASLDTKSVVSKAIAKAIKSPYSHTGVFMGRSPANPRELIVRDFKKGRKGANRPFTEAHKDGMVYAVMRWEKASPGQMSAFMHNIRNVKGRYDSVQALSYAVEAQLKNLLGVDSHLSWDVESMWTCSEQISHGADPSPKMLAQPGNIFLPVIPPMRPNPKVDRNEYTPKTIAVDGVNNRVLKVITMRKLP